MQNKKKSLSVIGRSTVINSLILSKCWYLFRVTPLSLQDLQKITSIAIQFVNQRIFPKISWGICTLPRTKGGLGIVDPRTQQSGLYLRWIQPLLKMQRESTMSAVSHMLRIHICNYNNSSHYELPLVFPAMRQKAFPHQPITSLDLIYRTVDTWTRSFDQVHISPSACLSLPLQVCIIVMAEKYKLPKKKSKP
jgi:hypothetical protein